ncbi:hypothetical protein AAG906_011053 [Vitis piasezkii]
MLHEFSKSSNNYMDELKNYQLVPICHCGVFNLVVQEEPPSDSMAFNTSSPAPSIATASTHNKPRRERPICTHCGLTRHTVDGCYKLHGFPPGYKHSLFSFYHVALVGSFPPPSLSSDQVQQLIAYLSTHLQQQTIDPLESLSTSRPSISQIYGNNCST